ncbi:MAG: polyprenyl synthetase family protein [Deltaproteobacteria bacterium]|nr:polyprenyl synthetase family protein [Deltaproteobacteria bacterium]
MGNAAEIVSELDSASYCSLIDRHLSAILEADSAVSPLKDAMRYAVLAPGKRFRPLIATLLYQDLGGLELDKMARLACSLELLHAASLVHDDLPAIDNDDMRRGQQSCHVAFSEATAILAGDYLASLAFRNAAEAEFSTDARLAVCRTVAECYMKLCSGQQLDILKSEADFDQVARLKTGALFSAAMSIPCSCLQLRLDHIAAAEKAGSDLGVLFQIADDFSDQHTRDHRSADVHAGISAELVHSEKWVVARDRFNLALGALERHAASLTSGLHRLRAIIDSLLPGSIAMPA